MLDPKPGSLLRITAILLVLSAFVTVLAAQNQPIRLGTLRGQIADPSGASIANAAVALTSPAGEVATRTTETGGAFEFANLEPGNYSLSVNATGFATKEQAVQISAGQAQQLAVSLEVATQVEEVTISEVAPTVDTSPSNNASAAVLAGTDLEAFSDDPDQLQADLQALAGSGGPTGGQVFIDGFTGGQLPPKSSIREIRINQNPFSAEYDNVGFGRVEILTKPGTDALHGRFAVTGNSSTFNTGSPFVTAANQVAYRSVYYDGNVSGSFRGKASFAVAAFRRNINDSAIVNAIMLDPAFNPVPFSAGVSTPQTLTNLSPRLDYQLNRDNTLTVRYQFMRSVRKNLGVGGFALPSQADNAETTENLLQIIHSRIIGERAVNETRFQYIHNENMQTAQNPGTSIRVTGAFTGGGSSRGVSAAATDRYELQNYTSLLSGSHFLKFGGRLRASRVANDSTNNFLGTYTFPSITAYQLTQQGLAQNLSADEIRASGGGANQFTITGGEPRVAFTVMDLGVYVQDDWKVRPSVTLSGGLRFETQNRIPDQADFAPRVGLAWSIGKTPRPTVLRAGFGVFYQRFAEGNILQLERLNGVNQQQYIVANPDFYPAVPLVTSLSGTQASPTVYSVSPNFRSAYYMQWVFTAERQLTKVTNISVNYQSYRAVHRVLTSSINAPLPGSITPGNPDGNRPFGDAGNLYQYQSASDYRGDVFYTNMNVRAGAKLSIYSSYFLSFGQANAVPGVGGFSSNPYDLNQDWGRPTGFVRQGVFASGTILLPKAFRISPLIIAQARPPFNITLGQDLNGDSIFNDRPAFATAQTLPQNLVVTPWGSFDTAPAAGATVVPINYGLASSRVTVNLRLNRAFTFGPPARRPAGAPGASAAPAAPGRYTLTLGIDARNVFNKVNLGLPVGILGSPLFGQANSLAGGPFTTGAAVRRIDLQVVFAF